MPLKTTDMPHTHGSVTASPTPNITLSKQRPHKDDNDFTGSALQIMLARLDQLDSSIAKIDPQKSR
jgi:hypothetical protein